MAHGEDTGRRLKDKVALVTGGGGTNSIGRSIALRLGAEGARVGVLNRGESATWVADEIVRCGGEAIPITCDITQLEQCEAAAALLADTYGGRIDILVNNAIAVRSSLSSEKMWRPFNEWPVEDWDYTLDVNLRGMWFCARAVFPYMQRQTYGKIINLTSSTFWEGVAGFVPYVTSKGGVIGFTRALARELGPSGIRVNALAPGFTLTEGNLDPAAGVAGHAEKIRAEQCLDQRNAVADDVAGPAFFLASPDSDFMTGQTLLVDGGHCHN